MDLLNENSTMSHWKYIPFSIYSIYRILPCKQWDLLKWKISTMSHWLILLLYILIFYIYKICKQWDLLKTSFLTMSHWLILLLNYIFILLSYVCKQWDLLNENSTMSHWKKLPLVYILYIYIEFFVSSGTWTHTVLHYYFLRIACLPISTCLHNYILQQKTNYPKNPLE